MARIKEGLTSRFGGRSSGWWVGAVAGILLAMWIETFVDIRRLAVPLAAVGATLGHVAATRLHDLREEVAYDPARRGRLRRRVMLTVGMLLFVTNILPEYRTSLPRYSKLTGWADSGGYHRSRLNSLLAGTGAVLVVLAFATKPKDDDF